MTKNKPFFLLTFLVVVLAGLIYNVPKLLATVSLDYFRATYITGRPQIELLWKTPIEANVVNFHVLRSTSSSDPNPVDIIGGPIDALPSGDYQWTDTVDPSFPYYYWLEAIDTDGQTSRFGPVLAIHKPESISVDPDNGSGPINTFKTFSTSYRDLDGATDIRLVDFFIAPSLESEGIYLRYDQSRNKIYSYNFKKDKWKPKNGKTPGEKGKIRNKNFVLDLDNTSVTVDGNILTVNWSLKFDQSLIGTQLFYLRAEDLSGNQVDWQLMGNWNITP